MGTSDALYVVITRVGDNGEDMETTAETTAVPTEALLLEADERPWAAYASCRETDPTLFFPEAGEKTDKALRICRGCAVLEECRDWALSTRVTYGVWGAMTERKRRRALRRRA